MRLYNSYTIKARLFPAIISAIPVLVLALRMANKELSRLFEDINGIEVIGDVGLSVILVYFLAQTNRFIGKEIFENAYFKDELCMPTTNYLLYKDHNLSKEYKDKTRKLIYEHFRISIPKDLEDQDINSARKRIVEAVGLIRNKVRDSKMLLQHNIEYGFVRNLIGGSPIGLIFSLLNIYYFSQVIYKPVILIISSILAIGFLTVIIFSKFLISRFGKLYAKRFFQEYLSKFC